jgi:septal ring-binding cell division protein DamX
LPREAYLPYVEVMYHEFDTWSRQENLRDAIKEMARRAGMSGDEFEKCLSTETDAKKVVAAQMQANKDYCISATPTFLMNGKLLKSGEIPWPELDTKLRAELKAKGVTPPAAAATEGAPAEGAAPEGAPAETPAGEAPKAEAPATDSAPADATTPKPATETTPTP